jgi:Asp-tRNA(Asn)/Glu-tRNA(Gln) amidotransferase A subunit family amidase
VVSAPHAELCYLDASELARRIRAREVSSLEVTRAYLERAGVVNPAINAIVTPNERALDEARDADAALARGELRGPLHGVPITIKDCFDTAGIRTTRASKLFADHVPAADATAVTRLKQAGGVVLGKTNLPEFALWWESDNLVFGRTRNPWNLERIAGGSTGGEAAALAAGLTALGLGSDVGGSIRQPAHCCGVVGLKPTHGRVPLTGHWPVALMHWMHAGPLARSVRDAALGLRVLAGVDGVDPYAVPVPLPVLPEAPAQLRALRVGVTWDGGAAPVDPSVRAVVERAANRLAELGCRVEPARIPALDENDWNTLTMTLYAIQAGVYLSGVIGDRTRELHPVLQRRLSFKPASLEDYQAALFQCDRLEQDAAHFFTGHDLLLGPCSPAPAHAHGLTELHIGAKAVPARHALRATLPWDITGSPALAMAFGWSPDRLPIAIQLVGRHYDEATVLAAGLALEPSSEVLGRHPDL